MYQVLKRRVGCGYGGMIAGLERLQVYCHVFLSDESLSLN